MKYLSISSYGVRSHHYSHDNGLLYRCPTMKNVQNKSVAQLGPGMTIGFQESIYLCFVGPDVIDSRAFRKVLKSYIQVQTQVKDLKKA